MNILGHQHRSEDSAIQGDAAPEAGKVIVEIGLVVALHLALALAVALTLNALGGA